MISLKKTKLTHLRDEASSVKECFTRYFFQAILFYCVIIGFVLDNVNSNNGSDKQTLLLVGFILAAILLLIVCRIGTHKYLTANRNYGFELFICSTKFDAEEYTFNWEEGLCVWRFIEPTVYKKLFYRTWLASRFRIPMIPHKRENGYWFEPGSHIPESSSTRYYSGRYLRMTLTLCALLAGLTFILYFYKLIKTEDTSSFDSLCKELMFLIRFEDFGRSILLYFGVINYLVIFFYFFVNFRRLNILEYSYHSIYSISILWHVIYLCHLVASKYVNPGKIDYTKKVIELADELAGQATDIEKWLNKKEHEFFGNPSST